MNTSLGFWRRRAVALMALAALPLGATTAQAAWGPYGWYPGYVHPRRVIVVAPPVAYLPPPVVYAPPPVVYAPPRVAYVPPVGIWVAPHWSGRVFINGYWR